MQVTNEWARELRENERETVLSVIASVMESDEFADLTMRDAAPMVLARVQHLYTVIEGGVHRRAALGDVAAEEPLEANSAKNAEVRGQSINAASEPPKGAS